MILGVYAVKDGRAGFLTPQFEVNDAVAMRNFRNAAMVTDSVFKNFAVDFALYKIGEFDVNSGHIEPCTPEVVVDGQ